MEKISKRESPRLARHPTKPHIEGLLALDLANTVACERCRNGDGLADSSSCSKWIAAHPGFVPVLRRTLPIKELRQLREAIRRVLAAESLDQPSVSQAIDCLNAWSRSAPRLLEFSSGEGSTKVEDVASADPRVSLLAAIARGGMDLAGDRPRHRIRPCTAPGCVHYLISRSTVQLGCSPTGCGNRVRVSRHYLKKGNAVTRPESA